MLQNSNKKVTKRVPVTLSLEQIKQINENIGRLGTNQSDVLKYIITNWLVENEKNKKEK